MKAPFDLLGADPQALARACAETMLAEDAASRTLGMEIEHIAPGRARLAMKVVETMVNGLGMCHGGYIFTLADSAFAFACNSRNEHAVAQHCSVTYLRPARLGMRLLAEATERSRAGRGGIYDVTVSAGDDVLAEFRGHCRMLGSKFFEE